MPLHSSTESDAKGFVDRDAWSTAYAQHSPKVSRAHRGLLTMYLGQLAYLPPNRGHVSRSKMVANAQQLRPLVLCELKLPEI
jgi:hypothetical protein